MVNRYETDWRPQSEALQMLGLSMMGLYRLREAGLIRGGVHYYRTGQGSRAPLLFNVPGCRLALQIHLGH